MKTNKITSSALLLSALFTVSSNAQFVVFSDNFTSSGGLNDDIPGTRQTGSTTGFYAGNTAFGGSGGSVVDTIVSGAWSQTVTYNSGTIVAQDTRGPNLYSSLAGATSYTVSGQLNLSGTVSSAPNAELESNQFSVGVGDSAITEGNGARLDFYTEDNTNWTYRLFDGSVLTSGALPGFAANTAIDFSMTFTEGATDQFFATISYGSQSITTPTVNGNFDNETTRTISLAQRAFIVNNPGGYTNTVTFDNLLVTAVPEPSSALLGGLGILALLRRRKA